MGPSPPQGPLAACLRGPPATALAMALKEFVREQLTTDKWPADAGLRQYLGYFDADLLEEVPPPPANGLVSISVSP